jgi:hypothetical protein
MYMKAQLSLALAAISYGQFVHSAQYVSSCYASGVNQFESYQHEQQGAWRPLGHHATSNSREENFSVTS